MSYKAIENQAKKVNRVNALLCNVCSDKVLVRKPFIVLFQNPNSSGATK